jgi:hypothetical protein
MKKGFGTNVQRQSKRVTQLKKNIRNLSSPDDIMLSILEIFTRSVLIPEVGKYYTFIYLAKTPNITYDQYPLIIVTSISKWGFTGLNFHWGTSRNYTWEEVIGKMHVVEDNEVDYLRSLPYAKLVTK